MANGEKYILTLNKEQALTVSKACEFYSRVMMGQFGEIAYETMLQSIKQDDFCARREMMEDLLFQARRLAFPDLMGRGHSYGIGHNVSADRAWNTYQALRYAVAWHEHPEGGITVDFQKPYPAGGEAVPDCRVEIEMMLFDKETQRWFEKHLRVETTLARCEKCGLFFKPELGHKCKMDKEGAKDEKHRRDQNNAPTPDSSGRV